MTITWTVDAAKRRVYVTVTRPYTREQGQTTAAAIAGHHEFAPSFGLLVEALDGANPEFVRDVLYFLSTHREKFRSARVAIVATVGSRVGGKSAVAATLAEFPNLPMVITVCATYREAERWLSELS
jgi:hypothetical protein